MFDDAEKMIAQLMRDATTGGTLGLGKHSISVNGSGNFLAAGDINMTFHIASVSLGMAEPRAVPVPPPEQLSYAGFETSKAAIFKKCSDLGDPGLYLPFIKAAYGALNLDELQPADLGRLEWWLGIKAERP